MHGPCGSDNQLCPCMVKGICSKHYPKEFQEVTVPPDGLDNYIVMKRRDQGRTVTKTVPATATAPGKVGRVARLLRSACSLLVGGLYLASLLRRPSPSTTATSSPTTRPSA